MNMFKIGDKINPKWQIDIPNKTIISGCRVWTYETLEELIEAIGQLKEEIEETKGNQ